MSLHHRLARAFCRHLTDDVVGVGGNMADIVAANAAETDNVCHSHDVVDANQSMLDAFQEVFGCSPCFPSDGDHDAAIVNAAWDLAKRHGFDVPAVCPGCNDNACDPCPYGGAR